MSGPDGSTQRKRFDYDETFSPTVRRETVFMVLHILAARDWDAYQMDVGSAYLEVPESRPTFMRMPDALIRPSSVSW